MIKSFMRDYAMKENNDKRSCFYLAFLVLIFVASIVLRLPFLSVERMWPDEALYAWTSQRVFEDPQRIFSKEISGFHPPLFTVLLSLGHFFWSSLEACRNVVFLLNLVGIWAIFVLGRRIAGDFVGCYSAAVLSVNLQYFNMSNFILSDGVLAIFMILFFLGLTKLDRIGNRLSDFFSGLWLMVLLLLKWSAIIVFPLIPFYYLFGFPGDVLKERLKRTIIALSGPFVFIGVLLWQNHQMLGSWVPLVFQVNNEAYREPFLFYWHNLHPLVFPLVLLPFVGIGLWVSLRSKDRVIWLQGWWVVIAFVLLSAMSAKDFRFLLLVIPSMVLISGVGLEKILSLGDQHRMVKMLLRPATLVIVLCYLFFVYFPEVHENVRRKAYTYTGYQQAGTLIKEISLRNPMGVIWASSPRMIRYFAQINFEEFGGKLRPFPDTSEEFVRLVKRANADMILAVDRWEMAQPTWVFPPTQESNQLFKDLGFRLEAKIERDVRTSPQTLEKRSVIWIFYRPANGR